MQAQIDALSGKPQVEWWSGRRACRELAVCSSVRFPLILKARLLVPTHGKYSSVEVLRLKIGVPTIDELRNLASKYGRLARRRRRNPAIPEADPGALASAWRPPKKVLNQHLQSP